MRAQHNFRRQKRKRWVWRESREQGKDGEYSKKKEKLVSVLEKD